MDLHAHLARGKKAIVNQWFSRLMQTYPADTAQFLLNQKDPFANPVGQNSLKSLGDIFDHLLRGFDGKMARPIIDSIIRIRAIQDFSASQAVGFIFDLKKIIDDEIVADTSDRQIRNALTALHARIDALGLLAFDVYMQCREKIYDLKANEMRARTLNAFNRAGLIAEPDDETSF